MTNTIYQHNVYRDDESVSTSSEYSQRFDIINHQETHSSLYSVISKAIRGALSFQRSGLQPQDNGNNETGYKRKETLLPSAFGPPTPLPEDEDNILRTSNLMIFDFDELAGATNHFSLDSLLGQGRFGRVFKGRIGEKILTATEPGFGIPVAIKCRSSEGMHCHSEWLAEIKYLGNLCHPNLATLLGYCLHDQDRLLVYEFMPRGSLDFHLFKKTSPSNSSPLSWSLRLNIALGVAKVLAFLHRHDINVIHHGVRCSNILLDSDFNARLSGFGAARDGRTDGVSHVLTRVVENIGFGAPEDVASGSLTAKYDVYSFGVVLLEILSGRLSVDTKRPFEEHNLVDWAKLCLSNSSIKRVVDALLDGQYSWESVEEVAKLILKCIDNDPNLRPNMHEVVTILEQLQVVQSTNNKYSLHPGDTGNVENDYTSSERLSPVSTPPTPWDESEIVQALSLMKFSFKELRKATRNFHSDTRLGQGAAGQVFKGWIADKKPIATKPGRGTSVAIKVLHKDHLFGGQKEWLTEIKYLGRLYHPNLVKLCGYCLDDPERLLVYEFMPGGSLDNHLFRRDSSSSFLSWSLRMRIALGAAKGLAFLHTTAINVIHRGVQCSNILLDSNFNAKLSDFGLAIDGPTDSMSHVSTMVVSKDGYPAPEYSSTGNLTAKCDVFNFGVVLLELISARRALDTNRPSGEHNLVDWAKTLLSNNGISRFVDGLLDGLCLLKNVQKVFQLALKCLDDDPKLRPTMDEVVTALEQLQEI